MCAAEGGYGAVHSRCCSNKDVVRLVPDLRHGREKDARLCDDIPPWLHVNFNRRIELAQLLSHGRERSPYCCNIDPNPKAAANIYPSQVSVMLRHFFPSESLSFLQEKADQSLRRGRPHRRLRDTAPTVAVQASTMTRDAAS